MSTFRPCLSRLQVALLILACTSLALVALSACGEASSSSPVPTPLASAPTAAPANPSPTPPIGLTLPFAKESDLGYTPAFVTVDDVPVMGFYVKKDGLVLAPDNASVVEILLIQEDTAMLKEGGIVLNFVDQAGFATQLYLWHGQIMQQDKSGNLRPLTLTAEQPRISYGPVYRGQVVALAGDAFPQEQFKEANLLMTMATQGGQYVPPDAAWLSGKPQYVATPTPAK